jgi:hypothetical protein
MSALKPYRDILVATLDAWMAAEMLNENGDKSSATSALMTSSVDAFNKAYHALCHTSKQRSPWAAEAPAAAAANTIHEPLASAALMTASVDTFNKAFQALSDMSKTRPVAPAPSAPAEVRAPSPNPFDEAPAQPYRLRWDDVPQWYKDRAREHAEACRGGYETRRRYELLNGGWATLPNKKRVMVYRGHAYEPPADRNYSEPGPLKHLGVYNREARRVEALAEGQAVPAIGQTLETYPWTDTYQIYQTNKKALGGSV